MAQVSNLVPNVIQLSSGTSSGSIRCGNFNIGTDPRGLFSNTAVSGFWNGISPAPGGYTIYSDANKDSGPSIVCHDSRSLVGWVSASYNLRFETLDEVFSHFIKTKSSICVNYDYPSFPTNNLVINYDSWFTPSYPTFGNYIYDMSGNGITASMVDGCLFSDNGIYLDSRATQTIDMGNTLTDFSSIDPWSFTFYFSLTSLTNGGLVSKGDASSTKLPSGFSIWVSPTGNLYMSFAGADLLISSGILAGSRYLITLLFDTVNSKVSFYLNGVFINMFPANISVTKVPLVFGKALTANRVTIYGDCIIYSVKKYNGVSLDSTQIINIRDNLNVLYGSFG